MSNPTSLFQQLRKTKQKELCYSSHLDNYRFYSLSRIIPTGLQIKCTPAVGNLPSPLQRRWNQILHGTSIRLINVLIEHCASSLDDFTAEITQLEHELQSCCSEAELERYNSEIDLCLSRQKAELVERRNRKIGALMENQQQRKHRRFSRPSTVDPAPISTRVVNLSSSTLTRPELCLLDKGLKYVPTPPEVNQVELSQDLTDYYRRIRLKICLPQSQSLFARKAHGFLPRTGLQPWKPMFKLSAPKLIIHPILPAELMITYPEKNGRHSTP